jgi:hypothetical protein
LHVGALAIPVQHGVDSEAVPQIVLMPTSA